MKIFLGTPITCLLNSKNLFNDNNKGNLQKILNDLRKSGDVVFCAIERESWGEELLSGEECTWLDYEEMLNTDLFIAIPNQSHGVYVEIGWASSLKKKIILLINEKYGIKSPLLEGLDKLTEIKTITFNDDNDFPSKKVWEDEVFPQLNEFIKEEKPVEVNT
ncbi:hypothetical protein EH196_19265 [Bacillus sp. C1-1]|nr:hypothetical protein EH196_19265 [Bacillus sp. C1-1]